MTNFVKATLIVERDMLRVKTNRLYDQISNVEKTLNELKAEREILLEQLKYVTKELENFVE